MNEIVKLKECFVEQLLPIRVYLFGSFANNTYTSESDLDFYIVVRDDITDILAETAKAYKAMRKIKQHPLDIFLGTKTRFEERKEIPSFLYLKTKIAEDYLSVIDGYVYDEESWAITNSSESGVTGKAGIHVFTGEGSKTAKLDEEVKRSDKISDAIIGSYTNSGLSIIL